MPVTLTCSGCNSSLKVRDDLAGKKVKCPRCAHLILVPAREEDVTEVLNAPDEGITEVKPSAKARKKPARDEDDEDEERDERIASVRPKAKAKATRPRDEDEEEERPKKRRRKRDDDEGAPQYKPCPSCGAEGAKRVMWTAWGSFYGPAMFTHVKCRDCGTCYNGKTGGSNIIAIIVFVTVPVLGIIGILGGLAYLFYSKGYFG